MELAEADTGPTLAAAAIIEAAWHMQAGIGWPDLDPDDDKK